MDTISLITRFVIIQITTAASHESLILPLATFTTRPIRSIHSRRNLPRGLEIKVKPAATRGGAGFDEIQSKCDAVDRTGTRFP